MTPSARLVGAAALLLALAAGAAEDGGCELAGHHAHGAAGHHAGHQGHGDHEQDHGVVEAATPVPSVKIALSRDAMSGWNLQVTTQHFRFAPASASGAHRAGEGHAHVYVDGDKLARLYGPWFHIPQLAPGRRVISVSLNANDHRTYVHDGRAIEAVATIEVE